MWQGATVTLPSSDGAGTDNTVVRVAPRSQYRSWGRRYAARLLVTDFLALLLAAALVLIIRLPSVTPEAAIDQFSPTYLALTGCLLLIWVLALTWSGSRDAKSIGYGALEYKRVLHATFAVFGVMAIVSYVFKLEISRSYLLVMLPVGLAAILVTRFTWRRWLHHQRTEGKFLSRVVAVGNVHTVTELMRDLRRAPQAGYKVIGVCLSQSATAVDADGGPLTEIDGVPVLGGLDHVADLVRTSGADTVAVTSTASFGPSRVRKLSWELEDTDAELILAPALTNIAGPRVHTQPVAGLPLIHVDRPTYRGANKILKKSFDVVGSLLLILLFSPVLIGTAIAIKVSSKGPVFFRQERVGINGEIFRMIKFRSMVVDAESRLDLLQQERGPEDAGNVILFKMKNDPRITGVGKFIRRFSIDELPQLFNVFTGGMSLVGPRPPLKAEVDLYEDEARRRLLVKPGMTGLWQVSGRSDLTWDDTVRLDVYYVENWSITGDMVIIWKTWKAVVSSAGAY
ncbi:sugar transferase [Nakamurella sp. GG22]